MLLRILLGILLGFALTYGITHAAETVVWDEATDGGVPKGVVGADGIRCTGMSTNGDVTYINHGYIGADAEEMASDPRREQSWQANQCRWLQELQHGWFWDRRGSPHQPVKITVERV